MRKRLIAVFLTILVISCVFPVSVYAESFDSTLIWNAVIKSSSKIDCDFPDEIDEYMKTMQPGDTFTIYVNIRSESDEDVDLYMANRTVKWLEQKDEAENGNYIYELSYLAPGKSDYSYIYYSGIGGGKIGFNEATDELKDFFLLGTYSKGDEGKVLLSVTLDGPTLDNEYQDTVGQLKLLFAVVETETPPPTGYELKLLPYYIIMLISGTALLVVAVSTLKRRKKEDN